MKRLLILLAVMTALGPSILAQKTVYVSPDVPTDDPGGSGTVYQPSDVIRYKGGLYGPAPVLSLPPGTAVDGLHKMDRPGWWLISVEVTTEIPPGGGVFFDPEDVIQTDGLVFNLYFDGAAAGIPPGSNVDAVFLEIDDFGDLILSFDVPTSIGAATYEPADLVRYSGGAFALFFDASATGAGVALSSNVIGGDAAPGLDILALDVPTDLTPSTGPTVFVPGQIGAWDTPNATYLLYDALTGWPLSSHVEAFSCQANPGRVYHRTTYPFPIRVGKSSLVPGNIVTQWTPSCSDGAEDYGVYEGTIGSWYSHVFKTCTDVGGDFMEDFGPAGADSYYLVVPHNFADEGAYGTDYDPTLPPTEQERPPPVAPGSRCVPAWVVTVCP